VYLVVALNLGDPRGFLGLILAGYPSIDLDSGCDGGWFAHKFRKLIPRSEREVENQTVKAGKEDQA
jgi:hypothetical protein